MFFFSAVFSVLVNILSIPITSVGAVILLCFGSPFIYLYPLCTHSL